MIIFSIVIPYYKQPDKLLECFKALEKLKFPENNYEIILINDGDQLPEINIEFKNLKIFNITHSGRAAARNYGVNNASGKYILFIDADVIVDPNILKNHLKILDENTISLGNVLYPPGVSVDILTKYNDIPYYLSKYNHGEILPFFRFLTCNLAVSKKLLKKVGGFNENFFEYGYEDIELGYRLLSEKKVKLIFNEYALCYHYHKRELDEFIKQHIELGKSQCIMFLLHPETLHLLDMEILDYVNMFKKKGERFIKRELNIYKKKVKYFPDKKNIELLKKICKIYGIYNFFNKKINTYYINKKKYVNNINLKIIEMLINFTNKMYAIPIIENNVINRYLSSKLIPYDRKIIGYINKKSNNFLDGNLCLICKDNRTTINKNDIKKFVKAFKNLPIYYLNIEKLFLFFMSFLKYPYHVLDYYKQTKNIFDALIFPIFDKIGFLLKVKLNVNKK